MRVALRHLPRGQFGLLPALDRAVGAGERAEPHARLAQRPDRCVCAARFQPLSARPQQRLAEAAYAFNAAIVPTPVEGERSTLGSCRKMAYPYRGLDKWPPR